MTHALARPSVANRDLDTALADVEERYVAANPESRSAHQRASESMPGGNTRTILHFDPFPLTIAGGEGAYVVDADGHRYADFLGEYSAALYGHSNPAILQAVRTALDGGIVLGGPNRYETELAELIRARFPSCARVRFCNSGTEANLMALSLACAATGRAKVMVFESAYHGGVLSFSGGGSALNMPFPYVVAEYNDLPATVALIEREAANLAAVIVEPMMGGGGAIAAEPAFLAGLREATERHGVVLIFDEVMTSRLSFGGLQGLHGITPDLTSFGKYVGGGLSFGAFGGREDLMMRLDPRRPGALLHSGTYNNNVLTMAAGVAGLKQLSAEALQQVNDRGQELSRRLAAVAERAGVPIQVSGVGSILCLHPQVAPVRRPRDVTADPRLRKLIHLGLLLRGIYTARRGYLTLSLATGEDELRAFEDAFADFVGEYRGALLAGPGQAG